MNRELFKQVQRGNRPSAAEHNKLTTVAAVFPNSAHVDSMVSFGGIIERRAIRKSSKYISRGEITEPDFTKADFVFNSHSYLDVAGIVPPNTTIIQCRLCLTATINYAGEASYTRALRLYHTDGDNPRNANRTFLSTHLVDPTTFNFGTKTIDFRVCHRCSRITAFPVLKDGAAIKIHYYLRVSEVTLDTLSFYILGWWIK